MLEKVDAAVERAEVFVDRATALVRRLEFAQVIDLNAAALRRDPQRLTRQRPGRRRVPVGNLSWPVMQITSALAIHVASEIGTRLQETINKIDAITIVINLTLTTQACTWRPYRSRLGLSGHDGFASTRARLRIAWRRGRHQRPTRADPCRLRGDRRRGHRRRGHGRHRRRHLCNSSGSSGPTSAPGREGSGAGSTTTWRRRPTSKSAAASKHPGSSRRHEPL